MFNATLVRKLFTPARSTSGHRAWLAVLCLGERHLLSAGSAWLQPLMSTGNELMVQATAKSDSVAINQSGGSITVTINGRPAGVFDVDDIVRLSVSGLGGNDKISVAGGVSVSSILRGGPGADTLKGGMGTNYLDGGAGNDRLTNTSSLSGFLFGAAGRDSLFGGKGDDLLSGGAGNDKLFGNGGNNLLWGGAGKDTLSGIAALDSFYQNPISASDPLSDFDAAWWSYASNSARTNDGNSADGWSGFFDPGSSHMPGYGLSSSGSGIPNRSYTPLSDTWSNSFDGGYYQSQDSYFGSSAGSWSSNIAPFAGYSSGSGGVLDATFFDMLNWGDWYGSNDAWSSSIDPYSDYLGSIQPGIGSGLDGDFFNSLNWENYFSDLIPHYQLHGYDNPSSWIDTINQGVYQNTPSWNEPYDTNYFGGDPWSNSSSDYDSPWTAFQDGQYGYGSPTTYDGSFSPSNKVRIGYLDEPRPW